MELYPIIAAVVCFLVMLYLIVRYAKQAASDRRKYESMQHLVDRYEARLNAQEINDVRNDAAISDRLSKLDRNTTKN